MADDIKEEQMTVASSVDYLRGLKGNNSVLISVLNAISNSTIVNKGNVKDDILDIVGNYIAYSLSSVDGSGIDGCLISINPYGLEGAQIKIAYDMSTMKVRSAYNNKGVVEWSSWKSISFT